MFYTKPWPTLILSLTIFACITILLRAQVSSQAIGQQNEAIIFAAIGDYGEDNADHSNVALMLQSWNPDFIISQGDNRYGSSTFDQVIGQRYCSFLTNIEGGPFCPSGTSLTNAFFPAPGNHDYDDGGGIAEYLTYFDLPGTGINTTNSSGNERYYDFIMGPVHFFVLNSDSQEPDGISSTSVQAQWLETQAAVSTAPWQVVNLHHAPFSSSTAHGSNPTLQWPFAQWGIDAVLAGHDHLYERIFQNGIVYYVNGLGGRSIYNMGPPITGSQFHYNEDFGALRITAETEAITFEFLSLDDGANGGNGGLLIDSYSLTALAPTPTHTPIPSTDNPAPPADTPNPPTQTPTPEKFSTFSPLIFSNGATKNE